MTNEYLFSSDEKKEEIKGLEFNNISVEVDDIENSSCWLLVVFTKGDGFKDARALSKAHNRIVEKYQPTVLTNESSAYFNRRLYPLFNDFERKLRKLLYIRSKLSKEVKGADKVADLEAKDFGELFELLFVDDKFTAAIKAPVGKRGWKISKCELFEMIKKEKEDTLWDRLMGAYTAPIFRNKFYVAKDYRNDVMHAHNIDYERYCATVNLIRKINGELDGEIGKTIKRREENKQTEVDENFNKELSMAEIASRAVREYFASEEYKNLVALSLSQYSPQQTPGITAFLEEWKRQHDEVEQAKKDLLASGLSLADLQELAGMQAGLQKLSDWLAAQASYDASMDEEKEENEENANGQNENGNS